MARTTSSKKKTASRRPRKAARTSAQELTAGTEFSRDDSTSSRTSRNRFEAGNRDYREIISELVSNPAVKYVAGGIATALLTRIANNMATRYPEISSFIRENLDSLEGRFGEYNRDLKGESARH